MNLKKIKIKFIFFFKKNKIRSEIVPDYSHSVFILDNFKEKK